MKQVTWLGAALIVLAFVAGVKLGEWGARCDCTEGDADYPAHEYIEDYADSEIAYACKAMGIEPDWESIQKERTIRNMED